MPSESGILFVEFHDRSNPSVRATDIERVVAVLGHAEHVLRYLLPHKVVFVLAFRDVKHVIVILYARKFICSVRDGLQDFDELLLVVHQETCVNVRFTVNWVFDI